MSPAVAFLIAELTKIAIAKVEAMGKFQNLTEDEAKAIAQQVADSLSSFLPSPEELEEENPPSA